MRIKAACKDLQAAFMMVFHCNINRIVYRINVKFILYYVCFRERIAMTQEVIKVFVGCDPNNCDLEQMMVLDYSIHKHTQHEVEIVWMQLSQDENSMWYSCPSKHEGWRTEKWATPFSGFRWAIPSYCQFQGRAIYMDADILVLCDLLELWQHPMQEQAVVIGKGGPQVARLCTCVWDCEKAKAYLPPLTELQSNPDAHIHMMQLLKTKPELVQKYTESYNCVDGESLSAESIKILHYSDMGTQFSHKYSLPRLQSEGKKHWFDGQILPHPRQDLAQLFDRYYQEALDAGYRVENYRIAEFGTFPKASQVAYSGNDVTRERAKKSWLSRNWKKLRNRIRGSKEGFTLDH